MAFSCIKFVLKIVKNGNVIRQNLFSTFVTTSMLHTEIKCVKKEYKTENNLVYLEDPDTFGTLTGKVRIESEAIQDEDDIKEEQYLENLPLSSQKLTTRQYAELIKQYIKHKRLKEAIDILEVRMLTEDRAKPENYIFNILIGACADVGYTKKAFKLYNDMKRRALKPTGDTYTCLFHACINSPWPKDGLKCAKNLREFMIEKGIEPNLTNYNSMIKAFGRCGDLNTSFKIIDEMVSKKIKIRVHTFNHLLHACISDKENGLRHALIVWRKMLKGREKPNIYSFNLMLKCVKECNIGTKEDIEELIKIIYEHELLNNKNVKPLQISSNPLEIESSDQIYNPNDNKSQYEESEALQFNTCQSYDETEDMTITKDVNKMTGNNNLSESNEVILTETNKFIIQLVENKKVCKMDVRTVPNLLSKILKLDQVLALQEISTPQDKYAIVGGQDDFLKEMERYSVKPDIKTFTQMLPLLEESIEAENKLMETMKTHNIKADIDFYNMLIKKRCLRRDYESAFAVRDIIEKENKFRKKRYPLKKKLRLKPNIMTYGVLAMACNTKESAEKLLNEMKENQLKINIEIIGTLLKNGTVQNNFSFVLYIMNVLKEENLTANDVFIKHLEAFTDKCENILQQEKSGERKCTEGFKKGYEKFQNVYNNWLKDVNIKEVLTPEHPWKQFREPYPETVQRQNIEIKEPKRFYKRNRKYIKYTPRIVK